MQTKLELYRKVTPLAQLGIWERNYATGEVYWNSIMYRIYEVPQGYLPFWDNIINFYDDPARITSLIEKAILSAEPQSAQLKIKTALGHDRWVKATIHSESRDGKCIILYGTLEDISSYVNLIDTMADRERRFQQAFDCAPIGMALVSLDGRWLKVNHSLKDLLGYTDDEFLSKTFQELTYSEDLELDVANVRSLLSGQIHAYTMEKRYVHKDGHLIWAVLNVSLVQEDQKPSYFISQIKDITERKKNIEELLRERQRLDNIIESTRVGTWEWDMTTDAVITNDRAREITGYGNDSSAVMAWWLALIHPDDQADHAKQLEQCFRAPASYYQLECRIRHRQLGWRWVAVNGKVIQWEGPRPLLMLGTIADIDSRKRMELERQRTLDQITRQNSRLLNFAHIVSHNLRSHAGNMKIMTDMLCEEQNEDEKTTMMGMLRTNAAALLESLSYLNEVVEIQTNTELNKQPLNLLAKVRHTLAILSEQLKIARAQLSIDVDPGLTVSYEPAYLESILLNLISNSIRYADRERDLHINISCRADQQGYLLIIGDNGRGIDLQLHGQKLFGMYKTFHGNDDARGIGLFLVKNQVEAMGGTIIVESRVGEGTVFKIQISGHEPKRN